VVTVVFENAVYLLKPVLDDPRFDGLLFSKSAKSVLGRKTADDDWEVDNRSTQDWSVPRLLPTWKPQPVEGPVRPFNDYPCLNLSIPAFSPRALEALRRFLESNGEILPLKHPKGTFYAFHILTKAEVLNVRESDIKWFTGENMVALNINRYEFHKTKLKGLSIFRLKEHHGTVMVTEALKRRVEECGLNGFVFTKVWPLPPGVHWGDARIQARRMKEKKLGLQGEALILRFRSESLKANAKEKRLINSYAEQLNELLVTQDSLNAPYFGAIDAVEFEDGDCRIFLTCPNVENLVKLLDNWIRSNDWPGEFHIVKRFGNLYDTKAKEKRVVIR
jgi:hypothetical protein